jgi:hypothetical protein
MAVDIAVLGVKKIPPLVAVSIIIAPQTQITHNINTTHAVGIVGHALLTYNVYPFISPYIELKLDGLNLIITKITSFPQRSHDFRHLKHHVFPGLWARRV